MSQNEMIKKIEALNEWEAIIADAQAEAEAIRDSIKQEMLARHRRDAGGDLHDQMDFGPLQSLRHHRFQEGIQRTL